MDVVECQCTHSFTGGCTGVSAYMYTFIGVHILVVGLKES